MCFSFFWEGVLYHVACKILEPQPGIKKGLSISFSLLMICIIRLHVLKSFPLSSCMKKWKGGEGLAENRILCQDSEVNSSVELYLSVNSQ